jgi:hypothetical protein
MSAPDAPTLPDRMPRERFIVAAPLLYNRKTPLRPDNKTLVSDWPAVEKLIQML